MAPKWLESQAEPETKLELNDHQREVAMGKQHWNLVNTLDRLH